MKTDRFKLGTPEALEFFDKLFWVTLLIFACVMAYLIRRHYLLLGLIERMIK